MAGDWESGELLHVLNGFNGLSRKRFYHMETLRDGSLYVNKLYIKEVNEYPVVNLALEADLEEQDANQEGFSIASWCSLVMRRRNQQPFVPPLQSDNTIVEPFWD
ncbi:hypothetical protein H5410_028890 [Solanum commersonii]|uniref:Uncharacterized protein n=1 Tax=Solanum commersonii TaxID=4109 RepID=A0A9J5Z8X5_SOLCO|nr:hypothetical protein H5410_028890 [Solanum commersonii]